MKNLLVMMTTLASIPAIATTFGERPHLDDRTFRQIAVSLQEDPEALRQFLKLTSGEETEGRMTPPLVSASEQLTLTREKIKSREDLDSTKVYKLDLDGSDFTDEKEREAVISYLKEQNLSNLRTLSLRNSKGASLLLKELFGNDQPTAPFVSLFSIDAKDAKITRSDLDTIFRHFSEFTRFYRDVKQVSARYDVCGAFLVVEGIAEGVEGLSAWTRGKKTDSLYDVHYMASDEMLKGPFIMRVEP